MRHNEIIPQFAYDPLRTGAAERIGRGLVLFLIGFVEKFFVADNLAPFVDPVFTQAMSGAPTLTSARSDRWPLRCRSSSTSSPIRTWRWASG